MKTTGFGSAIALASRPAASTARLGITTLRPGHVREPALEALRVLRRAALARAALGAQHDRHRQLAAGHEVRLRRGVDELVERERDEVDEHDLEHRPHARLRRADRDAA